MDAIKVRKQDIAAVLAASFPGYRGRTFRVRLDGTVRLAGLNWDGGSRSEYAAVRIGDGAARPVIAEAPWYEAREGARVEIPAGFVLVEHAIFCGRDAGITVHANPANAPRLLASNAAAPAAAAHRRDEDCAVGPDGCCAGCGASHGGACAGCGARAYHHDGCEEG